MTTSSEHAADGAEWAVEDGVRCVVCPRCAFTFGADHHDSDGGGYSCPLCAEVRLTALLNPEMTFRDLEMKVRDGTIDFRAVLGERDNPGVRMLAALMLNFLLGDGEEPVEPPNYNSTEITLSPAGEFLGMTCYMEVIKPGGRSSHQIRRDLEAEVARLRGDDA